MLHTESKPSATLTYKYENLEGVSIYDARIETVVYDHSPRNPSLPISKSSLIEYRLTEKEGVRLIRESGFVGDIQIIK